MDKDDKAKAALVALGLVKDLDALKVAQDEFEKIYNARLKEASEKEDPLVRASRKNLVDNLQALLVNLNLAAKLNEDGKKDQKVKALIADVNKAISDTMAIARARITRKGNQEKEDKSLVV